MKRIMLIFFSAVLAGCTVPDETMKKIVFLHHSTGYSIWLGKTNNYVYKLTGRGDVQKYINKHNRTNKTSYKAYELFFPKKSPYGWKNYPFDYYNIWVRNAGPEPFMEEATLEIMTREFDIIIFKHCFPVSRIQPDAGAADINSDVKTLENYKLQYGALRDKMHQFPDTRFIIWTPAVYTKTQLSEEEAVRTKEFRDWIINVWDEKGDNIFVWDFYAYETEGGLYLAEKNAISPDNSHPNIDFSKRMAPVFGQFIINVIESRIQ